MPELLRLCIFNGRKARSNLKVKMKKISYLKTNRRGLTLIETVVAMIIAALILLGFLQLCSTSMVMVKNIRYRLSAINIARAEIEDIRALGYGGIDPTADRYKAPWPTVIIDEGATAAAGDDITGPRKSYVKNTNLGPLSGRNGWKIIVQVEWTVSGTTMQEVLETVVYAYQ